MKEEEVVYSQDLLDSYRKEVHEKFPDGSEAADLYEETHFHGLTCGWALAKGMTPEEAYDFATHIRYKTDMG